MRHFNELDHELQARLNRAYKPAVKYMESFSSPLGAVIARCVNFVEFNCKQNIYNFVQFQKNVIRVWRCFDGDFIVFHVC